MTDPLVRPAAQGRPWTVDDLMLLPHDGPRYEILDGSLLVSPPQDMIHFSLADRIADVLKRQVPTTLVASAAGAGVSVRNDTTYYVPDVIVLRGEAIVPGGKAFSAQDVLLVVEVLSPTSSRMDLVIKRQDYAAAGIPMYWIVDPVGRTVTVLELRDGPRYDEAAVLKPDDTWATDRLFPLTVAPAEFFS